MFKCLHQFISLSCNHLYNLNQDSKKKRKRNERKKNKITIPYDRYFVCMVHLVSVIISLVFISFLNNNRLLLLLLLPFNCNCKRQIQTHSLASLLFSSSSSLTMCMYRCVRCLSYNVYRNQYFVIHTEVV